jgi:hypothetical protein
MDPVTVQQDKPDGSASSFFTSKNFNPSMLIRMVMLITAFLLGSFSIYLYRCVGRRWASQTSTHVRRPTLVAGLRS